LSFRTVIGTHVHCFSGKTLNYPTGQNFANSDAPQRCCIMSADSKFGRWKQSTTYLKHFLRVSSHVISPRV